VESQGPLAIVWVSLGLGAFYIALIWVNTLLGVFLTPLFIIPATWLLDKLGVGAPRATADTAGPSQSH
jgi:predicted Na+-dependent transporter